jgi:hypothetical protein
MLYSFRYPGDGEVPAASLIDVNGTLYGITFEGGAYGTSFGRNDVQHDDVWRGACIAQLRPPLRWLRP